MAKWRAAKRGEALNSEHDEEGSDEPKKPKVKTKPKRVNSSNDDQGSPAEENEVVTSENPKNTTEVHPMTYP